MPENRLRDSDSGYVKKNRHGKNARRTRSLLAQYAPGSLPDCNWNASCLLFVFRNTEIRNKTNYYLIFQCSPERFFPWLLFFIHGHFLNRRNRLFQLAAKYIKIHPVPNRYRGMAKQVKWRIQKTPGKS
jgi:hypothetical protein